MIGIDKINFNTVKNAEKPSYF